MDWKPIFFTTDVLIFILLFVTLIFIFWARTHEYFTKPWRKVIQNKWGVASLIILIFYVAIGLLDSMHYQVLISGENGNSHYSTEIYSVLDKIMSPLDTEYETSYSAPFATTLYNKSTFINMSGDIVRDYPTLTYVTEKGEKHYWTTMIKKSCLGIFYASLIWSILFLIYKTNARHQARNHLPVKIIFFTLFIMLTITLVSYELSRDFHILGTDKVGLDVFYESVKSIRTGLVIGTLTTLVMLPFAILLGICAGYFGGWIDDLIQYLYTTLSSIPGVLLIAASVLSLQIFVSNHPNIFTSMYQRADVRLLALCIILGVTSWTSLCRLLRGETMKLRHQDYVSAAITLGSRKSKIIMRHILPNVMHIVLIVVVLDFSGLVLAEAVLSYVGVGVDPTTMSWGNMINSARLELSREPVVWWPLISAFIFMFALVLSANLFADALRDAFDPRISQEREMP